MRQTKGIFCWLWIQFLGARRYTPTFKGWIETFYSAKDTRTQLG
ncbi:hypothetical protein BACOVA_01646 [Bacteroides ovatus ATCC 8483]|uniref:Uncharacterized protein n=1 Tax=Bacteroides ovatus (strain ATCC 8483 / DSM 1896 / JCM 5824 / BCRC 10623 / CCUG 4943 / NCTC 11153) TaxID=411476 RepID=A0AAN3D9C6_BACO1|nr:hypothetical protein BACOVA_01646 [Bacteroides ovatus ATCC 8483]